MSVYVGERFTFSHKGAEFSARIEHDPDCGAPWEESDGNVEVARVSHDYGTQYGGGKKPGEFVFHRGGRREYSYCVDLQEAQYLARRDGWGIDDETRGRFVRDNGRLPTPREVARLAVLANIEFLRGWCADDWQFVGVVVSPVCQCCGSADESRRKSAWGVESCGDYARNELCPELADSIRGPDVSECEQCESEEDAA